MVELVREPVSQVDEPQVVITRVFDAPRELVFAAWSDPAHLNRWHAPQGCTIRFVELDFRPNGIFRSCISNPQFGECWCKGTYHEIVVPERIVYSTALTDADGNLVESADVGHDSDWPKETIVAITFVEFEGKTKLTLHHAVLESLAKRTGAYPSWLQMLDRLGQLLAGSES